MKIGLISEYADVFSGYAFSSEDLVDKGIPVLKIGNIQSGVVDKNCSSFYSEKINNKLKKYVLNQSDFLIAMTGAGSVGRAGIMIDCNDTFLVNQRVAIVRCKDSIDNKYFYYYFRLPFVENYLYSLGIGAGQPNISSKDILRIKSLFHEKKERETVANVLFAYDKLIETNNKRIKILEQMAEELYKEWFVRFRFPGYETAESKDGIPKGWEIKRLNSFGNIETGKTPSTEKVENYGDEFLFVKTPEMHGKTFVIDTEEKLSLLGHNTQPKKLLPPNSIMVSCIGSGGIVALNAFQAHTNQQINSIVPKNEVYLEWLFYTCKNLKSTIEMFGATGTTMTNLSKGKFERLKVIEPTENYVLLFHNTINPILKTIKELQYINQNLIKQRDLLLPRLMSGKLEV